MRNMAEIDQNFESISGQFVMRQFEGLTLPVHHNILPLALIRCLSLRPSSS